MSWSARVNSRCVLADFDVAPHRHPVADVVGDQLEPVLVAPLVEELRLVIEELLDFLPQQQAVYLFCSVDHRRSIQHPR